MSRHTRPGTPNARRGFTLVEMLVVIVIIGMLAALLMPAIQAAREAARRANCIHNQGEIAKALLSYELSKKHFPGYANKTGGRVNATDTTGIQVGASWPVVILQQVDRADLWDKWREGDASVLNTNVDLFVCPSDQDHPEEGPLSYVANCGYEDNADTARLNLTPPRPRDWAANGVFHRRFFQVTAPRPVIVSVSLSDIKDGAQHTLLISENVQAKRWGNCDGGHPAVTDWSEAYVGMVWCADAAHTDHAINTDFDIGSSVPVSEGEDETFHHARPSSYHPGGIVAAYCDGSATFVSDKISYSTYQLLMTPDGRNAKIPDSTSATTPDTSCSQTQTLTDDLLNP